MNLGSIGETLAGFGDSLIKDPVLILIIILLIAKVWGVW